MFNENSSTFGLRFIYCNCKHKHVGEIGLYFLANVLSFNDVHFTLEANGENTNYLCVYRGRQSINRIRSKGGAVQ